MTATIIQDGQEFEITATGRNRHYSILLTIFTDFIIAALIFSMYILTYDILSILFLGTNVDWWRMALRVIVIMVHWWNLQSFRHSGIYLKPVELNPLNGLKQYWVFSIVSINERFVMFDHQKFKKEVEEAGIDIAAIIHPKKTYTILNFYFTDKNHTLFILNYM